MDVVDALQAGDRILDVSVTRGPRRLPFPSTVVTP
jgi:hypothetical protein